jgi:hypothetical protein
LSSDVPVNTPIVIALRVAITQQACQQCDVELWRGWQHASFIYIWKCIKTWSNLFQNSNLKQIYFLKPQSETQKNPVTFQQ